MQFLKQAKMLKVTSVGLMALLGGCVTTEGLTLGSKPVETTIVNVNGARIVVGGPSGFCINKRQSRTTTTGAFIVLGPCVPKEASAAGIAGLLVANVSPDTSFGQSTNPKALKAYFKTNTGRKLLSNSGIAKSVDILETTTNNGVFFIHTRDSSDPLLLDTTSEKWRGFFSVSERMVSISLVNFTETPISQSAALRKLEAFSTRILQLNGSNQ